MVFRMTGQVNWVTVTSVLLLAIGLVECNPRSQKSYGSVVGFSEPAFSASSYDSLGIQPSRTGESVLTNLIDSFRDSVQPKII